MNKLEEIAKLVSQHCCNACDGYKCMNRGNGKFPDDIAQEILDYLEENKGKYHE